MKYCKKCGVLYDGSLPQCPKCNTAIAEHAQQPGPEAPRAVKIRQWITLCIGIPLLIGLIYLLIYMVKTLS